MVVATRTADCVATSATSGWGSGDPLAQPSVCGLTSGTHVPKSVGPIQASSGSVMNEGTLLIGRPRPGGPAQRDPPPPSSPHLPVVLAARAAEADQTTGSGGSVHAGGSSSAHSAAPFSSCMRSHGVPRYPDPQPQSPGFPAVVRSAHDVGVSPSQLQTAEQACYDTLPINDTNLNHLSLAQCEMLGDCPLVLVQQALTQLREIRPVHALARRAQMARPHHRRGWGPSFIVSTSKDGFDPYSTQIQTKDKECKRVEHPNTGEPLMVTP